MPKHNPKTATLLEAAYQQFHSHYHRERDPLSFPHRYEDPKEQEIVAFLSSLLSYGNVKTILSSVEVVLNHLGPKPLNALRTKKFLEKDSSFRHRFTMWRDLQIIFFWLSECLYEFGSLENAFCSQLAPSPKDQISNFVQKLRKTPLPSSLQGHARARDRSIKYLLSDPNDGSACKRINMFLRWVARPNDGIDLGLWTKLSPEKLILPIDTHLLKVLTQLRWTKSKNATWHVAEEATDNLRLYCREDPVRFDFALCHLSMLGHDIRNLRVNNAKVE